MIKIDEKTIAIWYVQVNPNQDFMGSLFRDDNGKLLMEYRFRYYKEKTPWGDKDEKSWYKVEPRNENDSEEYMLESCRAAVKKLSQACGHPYDEILMKDGKKNSRCHDCNVAVGKFHHPGCDMEECPVCHGQALSCDCDL